MRHLSGLRALMVPLLLAVVAAGCSRADLIVHGVGAPHGSLKDTPYRPHVKARPSRPQRKSVKYHRNNADAAQVRHFCGERHLRFQSHNLNETPEQRARNNDLCRRAYSSSK